MKIYVAMVIGCIGATFGALAPIHEVWHWLWSTINGYPATFEWTRVWTADGSAGVFLAGPLGEILTLLGLFLLFFKIRWYVAMAVIRGYAFSFLLILFLMLCKFMPSDFEKALSSEDPVIGVIGLVTWIALVLVTNYIYHLVIKANYQRIFGKKQEKRTKSKKTLAFGDNMR